MAPRSTSPARWVIASLAALAGAAALAAAVADVSVLLTTTPRLLSCADFSAQPSTGWVRLQRCEPRLLEAVYVNDQGFPAKGLAWLTGTTARRAYVPVWGQGEAPPQRFTAFLEVTDEQTLRVLEGLRLRPLNADDLANSVDGRVVVAKLREPVGVGARLSVPHREVLERSLGDRLSPETVVVAVGRAPEARAFARVVAVLTALGLLALWWRVRRSVRAG